jgi:hypothetical protein
VVSNDGIVTLIGASAVGFTGAAVVTGNPSLGIFALLYSGTWVWMDRVQRKRGQRP